VPWQIPKRKEIGLFYIGQYRFCMCVMRNSPKLNLSATQPQCHLLCCRISGAIPEFFKESTLRHNQHVYVDRRCALANLQTLYVMLQLNQVSIFFRQRFICGRSEASGDPIQFCRVIVVGHLW